mgnify:CR=1 FL=1
MSLQRGAHVSELQKLMALTFLEVLFAPRGDQSYEVSMQSLAAVTQLKDLTVSFESQQLTMAALLPLTSLTALTMFYCRCWKDYAGGAGECYDFLVRGEQLRDSTLCWLARPGFRPPR